MTPLVFNRDLDVGYGRVDRVAPGIRRVVANNPGPFTFKGTGTYIIGRGEVAIIDPGPADDAHLAALLQAVKRETVTHLLITHTHRDHSPLAALLKVATGAVTYGFGPHPQESPVLGSASSPKDEATARNEPAKDEPAKDEPAKDEPAKDDEGENPEEGHDGEFVPDVEVRHGDLIHAAGRRIECVYTPGHISNHVCYALADTDVLFSGDHVMGWSTSVVSPPAGDMAAYIASLRLLLDRSDTTYWPTHGPAITDPHPYVRGLIAHRMDRERAIVGRLQHSEATVPQIVAALYVGLDERLVKAAGRSVLAHLEHLREQGHVRGEGTGDDQMWAKA